MDPLTFTSENSGAKEIEEINKINNVYYETEYQTEWWRANSQPVPNFLGFNLEHTQMEHKQMKLTDYKIVH